MTASTSDEPDSGYLRLEQQVQWYDRKSSDAQRFYKRTKLVSFVLSGSVPLLATINSLATAIVGVLVVIFEGLQQLNQWQHNWITYRSTCEALRHEKYSYIGRAGIYDELSDADAKKLLVERVEALISTEHAKWQSRQEFTDRKQAERKH